MQKSSALAPLCCAVRGDVTAVTRSGMDRFMVRGPLSTGLLGLCTCAPVASPAARNKCGADRAHTLHRCTAALLHSAIPIPVGAPGLPGLCRCMGSGKRVVGGG
jgi:hypothetical protein